jgi:hypothetical protein
LQPEIITISGTTLPNLPTASSIDSSDTENLSARPFVALKDRFHMVSCNVTLSRYLRDLHGATLAVILNHAKCGVAHAIFITLTML